MKKKFHIVNHKPNSCPLCKGRIITIIYGSVPPEIVQEAIEGKLILGGRFVSPEESPEWACINCKARFLKGYIELPEFKKVHPLRCLWKLIVIVSVVYVVTAIVRRLLA
ncbi:hypothetical protein [Elizabethkingia anophelis]|uniref:hypothetical protein n=1 Tax=Elizabethkingia anophelis TaxID=1117645 RepID=UPI001F4A8A64|nr:hypothetical protein [Elizabethkingia anophelis]